MKIRLRFYHWFPKLIRVGGITLYPYILIASERFETSDRLLRHELEHIYQVKRLGWFKFYFLYLKEYFAGLLKYKKHNLAYLNISFEVEARKAETMELTQVEREQLGIA